jgi:hypothetical protein
MWRGREGSRAGVEATDREREERTEAEDTKRKKSGVMTEKLRMINGQGSGCETSKCKNERKVGSWRGSRQSRLV